MTRMDKRRAFGWLLWICGGVYCAQYLAIAMEGPAPYREFNTYNVFSYSLGFNYFTWILPILSALPFATSFCADWNHHAATPQLLRCGRKRYVLSKIWGTWISGGLVSSLGTMLFFFLLSLRGDTPFTPAGYDENIISSFAHSTNMITYLAEVFWATYLSGALWAVSALAFSAYWPSASLSLCFPVLLHRASRIVASIDGVPEWLHLAQYDDIGGAMYNTPPLIRSAIATVVLLAFSIALGSAFFYGVRRRVEHG